MINFKTRYLYCMKHLILIISFLLCSTQVLAYNHFWSAMVRWCPTGKHKETGICVNNTKSCPITNGSGTQTWNGTGYGSCVAGSCNSGYSLSNNSCVATTISCSIANGSGTQTWNGSGYGSCVPSSCNSGYYSNGSACVLSTITVNYATYKQQFTGTCTTGNRTSQVATLCNGKTTCSWKPLDWGDPAPGAPKDACYSYSCGGNPTPKTGQIPAEAGFTTVTFTCP